MLQHSLKVDPNDWRAYETLIDLRKEKGGDMNMLITQSMHLMPKYEIVEDGITIFRIKPALSIARLFVLQGNIKQACSLYETCVTYIDGDIDENKIVQSDHNSRIMSLINSAACRCVQIQKPGFNASNLIEIEHLLKLAVKAASSKMTEHRVANAANSNLMQFYRWQKENFVGKTQLNLLF
jgi:hypothetical protein